MPGKHCYYLDLQLRLRHAFSGLSGRFEHGRQHRVYHHPCIEYDHSIQKTEYSGHGLDATYACPHLLHHAIPCLYATSLRVQFEVFELHVGGKSDKLFLRREILLL